MAKGWELFVGFRYLRSRRRESFVSVITVISTLSVLLGVAVLTIVLSVMTGFEQDLRSRVLGLHPHLRLTERLGTGVIDEPNEIARAVREDERVKDAAPVISAQMLVSTGGQILGVFARGVEVDKSSSVHGILDFIVDGEASELAKRHRYGPAQLPGVMIGRELGRRLGVTLGDVVTLMVPSVSASPIGALPRSRRFMIVSEYESGMIEYDSALVYMAIDDARALLKLGPVATGIEAVLEDPYEAPSVASDLNSKLGIPYFAQSWTEVHRNVFEALELEKTVYFLVLLLIILVSAFTIVATLYMVVMEKRRDIAVLKTMGADERSVAMVFVGKGLLVGVIGTTLGALLGFIACLGLERYEFIDLPEGVFYVSTLPVEIVPANFLLVSAASVIICLGACLFPAWKASRVGPVDVLRYE